MAAVGDDNAVPGLQREDDVWEIASRRADCDVTKAGEDKDAALSFRAKKKDKREQK